MRLDGVQVAEETREEPEEGLLLEVGSQLLVRVGEDENDDGEDLGHVVHLGLVVVGASRVGVVLDHEDDELGEGVDGLEDASRGGSSSGLVLDVAVDRDLGTDSEEERRDLFSLEDALVLQLDDEIDERLLDGERLLVQANPLGETVRQLLSDSGVVDTSLAWRGGPRLDDTAQLLEELTGTVITRSSV